LSESPYSTSREPRTLRTFTPYCISPPETPEIEIAGNGRAHELDLFVNFPANEMGERAYVWNQESWVAGVTQRDYNLGDIFKVEIVVRCGHAKASVKQTWRVFARDTPEIVPDGEKFAGEKAAEEAMRG
jgi:hypothetical protein